MKGNNYVWFLLNDGLTVMLRTYAPDIISISASVRYETDYDTSLEGYSQEWYHSFMEDPNEETANCFRKRQKRSKQIVW